MTYKLPEQGFDYQFRTPKDLSDDQCAWFTVHPEVGIRLSTHSHRNQGVPLQRLELEELKKFVDYMLSTDEPTLDGVRRALHPEDFTTESSG